MSRAVFVIWFKVSVWRNRGNVNSESGVEFKVLLTMIIEKRLCERNEWRFSEQHLEGGDRLGTQLSIS